MENINKLYLNLLGNNCNLENINTKNCVFCNRV